jgi:hypothetical protein
VNREAARRRDDTCRFRMAAHMTTKRAKGAEE